MVAKFSHRWRENLSFANGEIFMQTNLEQVTNLIHTLPLEDLSKLREVIDLEEQTKTPTKRKKKRIGEWSDIKRRGNGLMKIAKSI